MPRFPQEMSDVQVRRRTSRSCGGRVNHFLHFGNLCSRKAADLGVFVNYRFVLSEIDAEGLVVSDVALDPLDVGAELGSTSFDLAAAPCSCSRSKVPTAGISLSIMNLRSAMASS